MAPKRGQEIPELARNDLNRSAWTHLAPAEPLAGREPYWEAGSHPEIVERVWSGLGDALPEPCAFLVHGRPVLAHPQTGAILAFPSGTAYALWLTPDDAASTPLSAVHRWGNGSKSDLREQLGDGWFWGAFDAREPAWCRAAFDRHEHRRIR